MWKFKLCSSLLTLLVVRSSSATLLWRIMKIKIHFSGILHRTKTGLHYCSWFFLFSAMRKMLSKLHISYLSWKITHKNLPFKWCLFEMWLALYLFIIYSWQRMRESQAFIVFFFLLFETPIYWWFKWKCLYLNKWHLQHQNIVYLIPDWVFLNKEDKLPFIIIVWAASTN